MSSRTRSALILLAVTAALVACHARCHGQSVKPPELSPEAKAAILKNAGAPPGSEVTIRERSTVTTGGGEKTTKTGTSTGVSGHVEGDKLVLDIDGKASELSLTDLGLVKNDGFNSTSSASGPHSPVVRWIAGIVGVLFIAGGVALLYWKKNVRGCVTLCGDGVGLLASALWPPVAYWLLLGVALWSAGGIFLTTHLAGTAVESIRAWVAGLATLLDPNNPSYNPAAYKSSMKEVEAVADPGDLELARKLASKDGLNLPHSTQVVPPPPVVKTA